MDGQDVHMLQPGDNFGFLFKAADEFWIRSKVTRQDFQGNISIHRLLIGFVDCRHAPFAQGSNDFILTQLLSSKVFHDVSLVNLNVNLLGVS